MQVKTEHSVANKKRFPLSLAIAIAKTEDGKYNPITLGWWMCTSHNPPMYAISIGVSRYSLEAIRQAGAFVLSFPTEDMHNDTLYFGTHSGRQEDKLEVCGTNIQPATDIDCVLLSDALANFECIVDSETESGDHFIFVGRAVVSHVNDQATPGRLFTLDRTQEGFRLGGIRELDK